MLLKPSSVTVLNYESVSVLETHLKPEVKVSKAESHRQAKQKAVSSIPLTVGQKPVKMGGLRSPKHRLDYVRLPLSNTVANTNSVIEPR